VLVDQSCPFRVLESSEISSPRIVTGPRALSIPPEQQPIDT